MNSQSKSQNNRVVAGVAIIAIGLLALAGQFIQSSLLGLLVLPTLGLIFIAWGMVTRTPGLLIPGGVLMGLGTGAVLITSVLSGLDSTAQGGVFMICMALGFAAIFPLAWLVANCRMWWTLIAGSILGLLGVALMTGGMLLDLFKLAGYLWPLALVVIGGSSLYKAMKQPQAR